MSDPETAIILTPEMRQRIESRADSMLSSYWFDFEPTGDENVDLILGAVALAGKYAHSTGCHVQFDRHGYPHRPKNSRNEDGS